MSRYEQDPLEDCFLVTKQADGRFLVEHRPNRLTKRACCKVLVPVTDKDRAHAIPDADPFGECHALARASRAIEKRHAEDPGRGR